MRITKELEFDYGHRVPSHNSKCKNMHGHRGKIQVTLEGGVQPIRGESDDGMVIDFTDVKTIAAKYVEMLDHAFIVYKDDKEVMAFLDNGSEFAKNHKTVVVNFIPTAENLADWLFGCLSDAYWEKYKDRLTLVNLRFYETPTSYADATSYNSTFYAARNINL